MTPEQPQLTITVLYSCTLCDAIDEAVAVPARPSEQDVKEWVEQVMGNAIGEAHRRRHPMCPARVMKHVKIPLTNAEWVGGPSIQ